MPNQAMYAARKSFLVAFSRLLDTEVRGDGVRVQVVCPGVVRSEFHSRQNIDMSQVPRMEPEAVVAAALADLDSGVTQCVPGLSDVEALHALDTAQRALFGAGRATVLAHRRARPVRPQSTPSAPQTSSFALTRSITASVNISVSESPPRSAVFVPERTASKTPS